MTGAREESRNEELVLRQLRRWRFAHGLRCPHCNATQILRWGSFSGRQRYRCKTCGRTFSDLTATPAVYVKKLIQMTAYTSCLAEGLSVRRAAARTGVHPSTAFRWRHAFLFALGLGEADRLAGWIEFDWVLFPYSRKGQRTVGHDARRRGVPPGSRRQVERVSVWAACDRRGRAASGLCRMARPFAAWIDGDLAGRIAGPATLTDLHGRFGPAAVFARSHKLAYHDSRNVTRGQTSMLAGVETVKTFLRRLRGWLRRFRGVATRYLSNYLRWHDYWERPLSLSLSVSLLQWHDPVERHDPVELATLPPHGSRPL